jgi:predicted permease
MSEWRWIRRMILRLRTLFLRDRVERELEEELRFHIERRIEVEVAGGLSPEEARRVALRAMDGLENRKEECRDMRRVNFIDDLSRDIRYAGRSLRRSPGFTVLVVVIVALGIGANTAVFSVVNAVLLKPLSLHNPDRIVTLASPLTSGEGPSGVPKRVSIPDFQDWHDQSSNFDAMAYYQSYPAPVMPGSTAEFALVARVSPEFFRVFAVAPIIGRSFSTEELKPGGSGALLISFGYWQSHFGGDPRVLGHIIRVYGAALAVVGVLPPGFQFPNRTDLWYPTDTVFREATSDRGSRSYFVVGRLKSGISVERERAEMIAVAARLSRQYPETNKNRTATVTLIQDEIVGDVRVMLYLLLGAVSVVLLIACANTATLFLGRAAARSREVAVRVALGAGRHRIVRQLITESLVLALMAGALGLLFAYGGSKALVALAPANLPRIAEIRVDAPVLAFTLAVSLATSLFFGLVPALYESRVDLNNALKQGGTRSVTRGGALRVRAALVIFEIALAVVLLAGASLLIRSFVAVHQVALGFRPKNVLMMTATVPAPRPIIARQFFKDVLDQIANLPGVLAAGATMTPPGHVGPTGHYSFDHLPERPDPSDPTAAINVVAPGTFAALGIPIKRGRDFNENDAADRPSVAIVNEAMIRKSLPGQDPIGRRVFCSSQPLTVIGVVGDVLELGRTREPIPECYLSYGQQPYLGNTLSVVVRTAGNPTMLADALQRIAHQRSPDVPVAVITLESDTDEGLAAPRFRTLLFGIFAGLALCLAMAGVYGVIAYSVGQRTNEIGLRIALGASTSSVLRLILSQGLLLTAIGLGLGLAAAVIASRLLSTVLFQVKANDPLVYLAVAVVLAGVALAASYVPAWRASRIDPLVALRQD